MKKLSFSGLWLLCSILAFSQENLYIAVDNKDVSCIDKKGKVLFKPDTAGTENLGFRPIRKGYLLVNYEKTHKSVIYDSKGVKTFESGTYEFVGDLPPFDNHVAIVALKNRGRRSTLESMRGVIDAKGNFTIPGSPENRELTYAGSNMFVRRNQKMGREEFELIDGKGTVIGKYTPVNFDRIVHYFAINDGLIAFKFNTSDFKINTVPKDKIKYQKWGYMDKDRNLVIAPQYKFAYPFSEGFGTVITEDDEFDIINKQGVSILTTIRADYKLPPTNDISYPVFMNGMANFCVVAKNDASNTVKCGYIDSLGNWLIQPQYKRATYFYGGLAEVTDETLKTRMIDKKGKTIIEGHWGYRGYNTTLWDKDIIYVTALNTFFDHSGKVIWKPKKMSYTVTTYEQLQNMKESDLQYVETIRFDYYNPLKKAYLKNPDFRKKILRCVNLKELALNSWEKEDMAFPIEEFYNLKKLEILDLAHVKLTSLPKGIAKLTNLKRVDLNRSDIKTLPDDFYLLKLDYLGADNAPFSWDKALVEKLKKNIKEVYISDIPQVSVGISDDSKN